jgi:hypothetical protein
MVSFARLWLVFSSLALISFIFGCGEGEGGTGVVEPLADEPMILESVMCLDVDDARPVLITDSFLKSDNRIVVWIYWTNLEKESNIEVIWFAPDEDIPYREDSQTVNSDTGYAITWFYLEKPDENFDVGEWSVDIYLDDLFERSHLFIVGS